MLVAAIVSSDHAEPVAIRGLLNWFLKVSVVAHRRILAETDRDLLFNLSLCSTVTTLNR